MKKTFISLVSLLLVLIVGIWFNSYLYNQLNAKFLGNFTYVKSDKESLNQTYLREGLDSNHGMWYQYSTIQLTSDTTFYHQNRWVLFQTPSFPLKYYTGFLFLREGPIREFNVKNDTVFSDFYSNPFIGYFYHNADSIYFESYPF